MRVTVYRILWNFKAIQSTRGTMQSSVKSGDKPENTSDSAFRRFSVAPMLDWTDTAISIRLELVECDY